MGGLFRRNPVTIVHRHVGNKRKTLMTENVDEGVTFASSVPSHMAQLHSTWIYVCCHRLVGSRQNSIQIPLLGTRRWNRGLASSALSQKFI